MGRPKENRNDQQEHGETHTARMMRAAARLANDTGATQQQAKTILDAAMHKLSLEEKWELARKMEEESEDRVDDQT